MLLQVGKMISNNSAVSVFEGQHCMKFKMGHSKVLMKNLFLKKDLFLSKRQIYREERHRERLSIC